MMAAMIGNGMWGGFRVISQRIHSGDVPPGVGRSSTETPSQTKDMPRVTTIEGKLRREIRAPSRA